MFHPGLSDLDAMVLRCRNGKAKSYLGEAITCLKAGAFRAAIVVTWVAVVHDILAKLEQLALAGDNNAQKKLDAFGRIVESGDVGTSLEFERTLLDVARKEFELFGALAYTDLCRLREDRNRCAHPSMIDPATDYQPTPELARCHIVSAVTHLLEHGAAQGKAAMDRLFSELDQTYFPITVDSLVVHLEHGALGTPRASLVRNYVVVLLKHLLSPPPMPEEGKLDVLRASSARKRTNTRALLSLQAVLRMHRELALKAFEEKLDELVGRADDARLGDVLVICATVPELWTLLSRAQRNRLSRFVQNMPQKNLTAGMNAAWTIPELRPAGHLRLSAMTSDAWKALSQVEEPPEDWVAIAVEQLCGADSWGKANPIKEFLVPCASRVSEEQLASILEAAKGNEQLRKSWGVKDVVWALIESEHLGQGRVVELISEFGLATNYSAEPWWPKAETVEQSS